MAIAQGTTARLFDNVGAQPVSDMAWLSHLTYDEGTPLGTRLAARGWRPLGADELGLPKDAFNDHGYYDVNRGEGFAAVHGSVLALAFRGSDDTEDLIRTALDQQSIVKDARPLMSRAMAYLEQHPEIDTVYLTGQSLGGALATSFAAKIDGFTLPNRPVDFRVVAFGTPGCEIDDRNDLTRASLEIGHTGDPVPTDRLLSRLEHHGRSVDLDLPLFPDARDLAELAAQKNADLLTEHDSETYLATANIIAASPLYDFTTPDSRVFVLSDDPDGDVFRASGPGAYVLAAGGNDTAYGTTVADLLDGGAGDDRLYGGAGDDRLAGMAGVDLLSGGDGNDTLWGGTGNDVLSGGNGADLLAGSHGNDQLRGDDGNDRMNGGLGSDVFTGGAGRDICVLQPLAGGGTDRFTDFQDGLDRLDVRSFHFGSFDRIVPLLSATSDGVLIALSKDGGENLLLDDVALAAIGANDFLI